MFWHVRISFVTCYTSTKHVRLEKKSLLLNYLANLHILLMDIWKFIVYSWRLVLSALEIMLLFSLGY